MTRKIFVLALVGFAFISVALAESKHSLVQQFETTKKSFTENLTSLIRQLEEAGKKQQKDLELAKDLVADVYKGNEQKQAEAEELTNQLMDVSEKLAQSEDLLESLTRHTSQTVSKLSDRMKILSDSMAPRMKQKEVSDRNLTLSKENYRRCGPLLLLASQDAPMTGSEIVALGKVRFDLLKGIRWTMNSKYEKAMDEKLKEISAEGADAEIIEEFGRCIAFCLGSLWRWTTHVFTRINSDQI